ncbi:hypothetical protein [Tenacibaculum piscium]|uniref:Glycine zipper domain-containing protein n=1 Tax=Tenacibaculum piscium TaxID=1458515 RepID=A0A2H1YH11_9FLAO|nr:hypothetical protein [Tenacibaculum piscium]MBE7630469.1 hypothetical protein [Tenacibaculum piscium]MBE7671569.1 hypothetical protein [Tenacibaculum piscium]MBE7671655.1 hypothetical protein [Tenacibaculum piscium]SOS74779.1 conserved hypothetical protein [Tenacibaculum piscium]
MRLFVRNRQGKKVILDITANSKRELARKIGYNFYVENQHYSIRDVQAESSSNDTAGGAVIGGLLGLLGGGIGVVIGGIAGGLIGGVRDEDENKMIRNFNNSRI